MSLERIDVTPTPGPLPTAVARFVRAAEDRIEEFDRRRTGRPLNAFASSDLGPAWRTLDAIARGNLASGRSFCEWGCGFAAVAGLAALAGFDAVGIEFERDLVEEARRLTSDFGLNVAVAHGNFIPQEAEALVECVGDFTFLREGGPDGHDLLRRDPDDFDLVFAYPWPGEEESIFRVFDHIAAPEALLLTFHGREGLRVDRKSTNWGSRRGRRGMH